MTFFLTSVLRYRRKLALAGVLSMLGLFTYYCVLPVFAVFLSLLAAYRGIKHSDSKNGRGDSISLDVDTRTMPAAVTRVTLDRSGRPFSIPLTTITSSRLSFDIQWIDDDHATVLFRVDKNGTMRRPRLTVGRLHISYSLQKNPS